MHTNAPPRLRFTRLNLPTKLTVVRVVLVPVFIAIYLTPVDYARECAAVIFAVACITDYLDGYLARKLKQTTAFGAFLDPIADKLIVISALVLLLGAHGNVWLTVPALIIITREIVMTALRQFMAAQGNPQSVRVSFLGKAKTTVQMVAILMLLFHDPDYSLGTWALLTGSPLTWLGYVALYAAALTIVSMGRYLSDSLAVDYAFGARAVTLSVIACGVAAGLAASRFGGLSQTPPRAQSTVGIDPHRSVPRPLGRRIAAPH